FDFEGIEDPKITLVEALDQLVKIAGVTFDVDEKAFKFEMLNDVLKTEVANPNAIPKMPRTTLAHVLKIILGRVPVTSGATYLIRKDHIEITTQDAVRRELGLRKQRNAKPNDPEEQGRPALPPLVWENLEKVPLDRALRDIADDTGVNVVLD